MNLGTDLWTPITSREDRGSKGASSTGPKTLQWEQIMKPNDISLLMLFVQPAEPPRLAGTEGNYKKKGFHAATEFTTSFDATCRTKFGQKNHNDFLAKFPFTGKSPTKTGDQKKTQPMHENHKNRITTKRCRHEPRYQRDPTDAANPSKRSISQRHFKAPIGRPKTRERVVSQ